jgi:hypothetical protein
MTAALAASLRQTFTGLLAQDARLGDVEPVWVADDLPQDEPEPEPEPAPSVPVSVGVAALVGRKLTTPRARKATRKATFTPRAMAQALTGDDLL